MHFKKGWVPVPGTCRTLAPVVLCLTPAAVFTGDAAAAGSYGYTNSGYSVYEEENDRLTESLRTKVSAIKSVRIELQYWIQLHGSGKQQT